VSGRSRDRQRAILMTATGQFAVAANKRIQGDVDVVHN
jgi:hypothetical protein